MISRVVKDCFRPILIDKLYQDLSQNPFSLSLDTTTVCAESICALRVRYLKDKVDALKKFPIKHIENKLLGVKTMGESSEASAFFTLIEEKVSVNEELKKNFYGITHDNASCFTGGNNGLITLCLIN